MRHLHELVNNLQLADIPLKQGEPLYRHTSFQIGGPASVMAFPESRQQLQEIYRLAASFGIRPMILGAGSNVLAPDEGLDTLIVETRTGLTGISMPEDCVLEAECGVTMAKLAVFAADHGLGGLEFAHGIPGTVGGGVYMNAGAYGGEMVQVVESVTAMELSGALRVLPAGELELRYRHSIFMEEPLVIVSVRLRLIPGDSQDIRSRMQELMGRRRASQPLECPSAGSTFKRPAGGYAAAMIEAAGLKGLTVGGAQVSTKHAGFIVNTGRATAADVMALVREVQDRVEAHCGTRLEPEVRIWR